MALFSTEEEITSACNAHGYISGRIELDFEDVVDWTRADLEEKLTRALVGHRELEDLSFVPAEVNEFGMMILAVNGKAAF